MPARIENKSKWRDFKTPNGSSKPAEFKKPQSEIAPGPRRQNQGIKIAPKLVSDACD